nr:crossover junction endodeoxyribonuclease RuvC [Candidatus Finniella inopinata]
MVKILGLDPGLRHTGWGVIKVQGNSLSPVAQGTVDTDAKLSLAERLNTLFQGLMVVLEDHQPDEAVVEETFVNNNAVSTLKLGMARGVVLLAPASLNIPVFEYSANKIKKSVVGVGHADKSQVLMMVQRLLPTLQSGLKLDAADALAAAICHAHHTPRRI